MGWGLSGQWLGAVGKRADGAERMRWAGAEKNPRGVWVPRGFLLGIGVRL